MIKDSKEKSSTFYALGLAWELGYTIAVPLTVFALGGRFLDKTFNTSPFLLLAGIFFSIIITSWLVYRKVTRLFKDMGDSSR